MAMTNLVLDDINDPRFRSVCEQILERMERKNVPGVAIGILCDGVLHTAGLGITSIEHPQPVTSRTLFQIGSTGKTYTALAALRLVEQGSLDLEKPLRSYLPELRLADEETAEKAILRHLLTHTGGWFGDHFIDCGAGDDALARYTATLDQIPQISPLGEVFSYCNSGFILAGRVIEAVTGKVYETAMQELVLGPLGLVNTFYFAADVMNRPYASGHHNEPGTNTPLIANPWPVPRFAAPAGGVIADIHDQLKYARFLMGDGKADSGKRVLQAETLEMMRTPQVRAGGGLGDWVGLSLMLQDLAGERVFFHGGSINGQQSDFRFVPSRGFALALNTNADNGIFLHMEMAPLILETFLGLRAAEPTRLQLPVERLMEYAGTYKRHNGSGYTVGVNEEGQLIITGLEEENPDMYITEFIAEDKVIITNPPAAGMRCDFIRGPKNEIVWLRESGRIARREDEPAIS